MNQKTPPPKPLPVFDKLTTPFWEAANRDELLLQRCGDCGTFTFYPRYVCNQCMSSALEWTRASGRGTIYSFTVTLVAPPAFRPEAPYALVSVELEEGVRILAGVEDIEPEDLAIGREVVVSFREAAEGIKLPCFRPA